MYFLQRGGDFLPAYTCQELENQPSRDANRVHATTSTLPFNPEARRASASVLA